MSYSIHGVGDPLAPGDALGRALRWLLAEREERPEAELLELVDEAALRFDLAPIEAEFIVRALVPPRPADRD